MILIKTKEIKKPDKSVLIKEVIKPKRRVPENTLIVKRLDKVIDWNKVLNISNKLRIKRKYSILVKNK